jgi:hypothetical protein
VSPFSLETHNLPDAIGWFAKTLGSVARRRLTYD